MLSLSLNQMFTRQAAQHAGQIEKTTERMSSAKRLNRAADDAGGLGIAESLRTQVRGAAQAARNIQDGISMVKFGLDGVEGTFSVLQRLRELIVQAANGTYSDGGLEAIQGELDQVKQLVPEAYLVAVGARREFDGDPSDRSLDMQVGANHGQTLRVDYNPLRNKMLNLVVGLFGYNELYDSPYGDLARSVTGSSFPPPPDAATDALWPKKLLVKPNSEENIATALALVDQGLRDMTHEAAYLGAQVNRMEHELENVRNQGLQMAQAESRIRDADMAEEMATLAKQQITQQASTAMVAQAHTKPTALLELVLEATEDNVARSQEAAAG